MNAKRTADAGLAPGAARGQRRPSPRVKGLIGRRDCEARDGVKGPIARRWGRVGRPPRVKGPIERRDCRARDGVKGPIARRLVAESRARRASEW